MAVNQIRTHAAKLLASTHISVRAEGDVWQNRLNNLLVANDKFFGLGGKPNFDWPNPNGPQFPIDLRNWTISPNPNLAGKDKFFGLAGSPQFDWPNPRGPAFPSDLRTTAQSLNLNLQITVAPFVQTGWPNPRGPAYPLPPQHYRLSQSTAPVIPLPSQVWIGTRLTEPTRPNIIYSWSLSLNPNLLAAIPFVQTDWPNPRGPATSWTIQPSGISLLGFDTFYGAPGQVPTYEMPVPRGPAYPTSLRTWIDPLKRFPVPPPFALLDWPNPSLGAPYPTDLRTWIAALKINLTGQDQFFGLAGHPNFDWPVPKGYVPATSLKTWIDQLKLLLASQDQFFGLAGHPNFDWPIPKGAPYPQSLRVFSDALKLLLLGQDGFFGLAGHPNFDWPNPRGYQFPSELRTWLEQLNKELIGQDTFFAGPGRGPVYDYPNPRGPVFPIVLRTWADNLKYTLNGRDTFFGLAGHPTYDWPVPKGPIYPVSLRTLLPQPNIDRYIVNPPFAQLSWPVPQGYTLVRFHFSEWRGVLSPITLVGRRKPFLHGGTFWEGT